MEICTPHGKSIRTKILENRGDTIIIRRGIDEEQ